MRVLMSRGPGRIERAIEAAFTTEPNRAFTVEELARAAYPGVNRVEKKHRVALLRAAHNVAERLLWRTMRGGENGDGLTFYNPVELRSYAQAHLRWCERINLACGDTGELERNLAALDDPSMDFDHRDCMEPGGPWWEFVEIERCRRSGDHARADELEAKHTAQKEAFRAGLRAFLGA
jgi:hypothetical protein